MRGRYLFHMRIVLLFVIVLSSCNSLDVELGQRNPNQPTEVLDINDLETLSDEEVKLNGIFHYRFEDVAIYMNFDSKKKNALWVDFHSTMVSDSTIQSNSDKILEALDGRYVEVEGIVNKSTGHLMQYAGTIEITYIGSK